MTSTKIECCFTNLLEIRCQLFSLQFVMVEVVVTSIRDGFPRTMHKYFKRHELRVLVVCVVSFLVGLPNVMQVISKVTALVQQSVKKKQSVFLSDVTQFLGNYAIGECTIRNALLLTNVLRFQGGIYIFQLLDDYTAKFSLMYLAFFETLAVIWIYGVPRLSRNIYEMTGAKPSAYFIFCWRYAAPILLLVSTARKFFWPLHLPVDVLLGWSAV